MLTCRVCETQWKACAPGRPAKLCVTCRVEHRVCYKCDQVKAHSDFYSSGNGRDACIECLSAPRSLTCQECEATWQLNGCGVPPRLCPTCETTLKVCHKCQKTKPHSDFNRTKKTRTGLNDACRACAQQWFKERGSKLKRINDLRNKYDITLTEWNAMWDAQNGKCACCRRQLAYKPAVDHCHKTLAIRGILCSNCNTGIGKLGDTPEGLERAEDYLWSKRDVLSELTSGVHNMIGVAGG